MNYHWRSLLFVPGNRPERFAKAFASGADAVCVDLEDAVATRDKQFAREQVADALATLPPVPTVVRLNALESAWHADDVKKLQTALPQAVCFMLPKARLNTVQNLADKTQGRPLFALIESAAALEEAYQIAAEKSVAGLILGGADLSAELGTDMNWEALFYARSRLLLAAASAQILAIDVPCLTLKDTQLISEETQRVKALGYSCKGAIHPAQIEPIHAALTPTADEIEGAESMLAALETSQGDAVEWRGVLLDEPIIAAAKIVLARAGKTIN